MCGNSNDHEIQVYMNIWYDRQLINEFEDIHHQKKKKNCSLKILSSFFLYSINGDHLASL